MTNEKGLSWLREAAMDRELSSGILNALVLIWLDCWDGDSFQWSKPITVTMLAESWDVHRATAWRQIERLKEFGWIDVQQVSTRVMRIRPSSVALVRQRRASAPGGGESISIEELDLREETPSTVAPVRQRRASATIEKDMEIPENLDFWVDMEESDFLEKIDLLTKAGAYKSVAATIAALDHADLDYIQGWLRYIKIDKDRAIGFALTRMQDGDAVPDHCYLCGGITGHKFVNTEEVGTTPCPLDGYSLTPEEIQDEYGEVQML